MTTSKGGLPRQDRFDLTRVYREQLMAYWKEHGKLDDDNIAFRCYELLWGDEGYAYIGRAIDTIVRLSWLRGDYKKWQRKVMDTVAVKGETGFFDLDEILHKTKEARAIVKLRRSKPQANSKTHDGVPLPEMSFNDHRRKGEEYFQVAAPNTRKGQWHTGIYMVGSKLGIDLDQKVPPEILGIEGPPEEKEE